MVGYSHFLKHLLFFPQKNEKSEKNGELISVEKLVLDLGADSSARMPLGQAGELLGQDLGQSGSLGWWYYE